MKIEFSDVVLAFYPLPDNIITSSVPANAWEVVEDFDEYGNPTCGVQV